MNEMCISRRDAVKAASIAAIMLAAGGTVVALPGRGQAAEATSGTARQYGFLMDTANCVNCGNCATACRNYNDIPEGTAGRRKVVAYEPKKGERAYVSTSCMHCEDPSCETVCPAGAISKGEGGVVTVDKKRCIGCKYCHQACPYGVPHYDEEGMDKCDCCLGSGVKLGDTPHCVDACHYDALHYGPVDDLVAAYGDRAKRIAGPTQPSAWLA